jgi:hypothetical protein
MGGKLGEGHANNWITGPGRITEGSTAAYVMMPLAGGCTVFGPLVTPQFWSDYGWLIVDPRVIPLLLICLWLGYLVKGKLAHSTIENLKSSNQALNYRLDLATDKQKALSPEIEQLKAAVETLSRTQTELKDAHTPQLEKLSATTAAIEQRLAAVSQSNTTLGTVLQLEARGTMMSGSSTRLGTKPPKFYSQRNKNDLADALTDLTTILNTHADDVVKKIQTFFITWDHQVASMGQQKLPDTISLVGQLDTLSNTTVALNRAIYDDDAFLPKYKTYGDEMKAILKLPRTRRITIPLPYYKKA